jgi:hypothetical protein
MIAIIGNIERNRRILVRDEGRDELRKMIDCKLTGNLSVILAPHPIGDGKNGFVRIANVSILVQISALSFIGCGITFGDMLGTGQNNPPLKSRKGMIQSLFNSLYHPR